jgi:hypothetical protein
MDWLAPGNKAWRGGWAAHVRKVGAEAIAHERERDWPPPDAVAPQQFVTGTLRDLRCVLPCLWKLHGGNTKVDYNAVPREERLKLLSTSIRLAAVARKQFQDTPEAHFFEPDSDILLG